MVFDDSLSMGLVDAGYSEYDCDYAFATVQALNRDSHLYKYEKDAFDCIILDEAHHLCPFYYFGITEMSMVEDRKKLSP